MEPKYNHKNIEANKHQKWVKRGYFSTHDKTKKPFTIILPPPNITGKLHLGHALNSYLQDSIIRYKKLQGYDVLWIPSMDHAGIATQSKIEEKLQVKGLDKNILGRQKFLEHAWKWKKEYAKTIHSQWSKLGLALSYPSEKFTMDKTLQEAVNVMFINLYERHLIYRGQRGISYDLKLQTVLSNIEVENKITQQKMYYIKYPLEKKGFVIVATTRPETLFSDVALAINPLDTKNKHLIGKKAIHPLTRKVLPIISDKIIEIKKGTGIMKVSAHAEIDVDIIIKNKLNIIECINMDGKLNKNALEFEGLDRFVARKSIVAKLQKQGLINKIEDNESAVGYSQRSQTPIEILVRPQWFVKMKHMTSLVLNDLKQDEVNFYPKRFKNDLKRWMEVSHDWCISRQLWWGHQIPVYYKNGKVKVQSNHPRNGWIQDEDVLDTWFSSALAPFSFLGWPQKSERLDHYYPINLLVTGYDIIFFWIARMYFKSLDVMKQKPFQDVLIHGLIRTNDGKKMSKSLGNGIDPMNVIEQHGSDALRWFLLTNSTPGQDIRYSNKKIAAAWNINNKLWNTARYILEIMEHKSDKISAADIYINNKLYNLQKAINKHLKNYDFSIIGKRIYKFLIEDFSSHYIELLKVNANKQQAIKNLQNFLIILHPFLPFITDHIYSKNGNDLLMQNWPLLKKEKGQDLKRVLNIIKLLRNFRTNHRISVKKSLTYYPEFNLHPWEIKMINKLVNASIQKTDDAFVAFNNLRIFIALPKSLKAKEEQRIGNEITHLKQEIKRAKTILNNQNFIIKAPVSKVNEEKQKLKKYQAELEIITKIKKKKI